MWIDRTTSSSPSPNLRQAGRPRLETGNRALMVVTRAGWNSLPICWVIEGRASSAETRSGRFSLKFRRSLRGMPDGITPARIQAQSSKVTPPRSESGGAQPTKAILPVHPGEALKALPSRLVRQFLRCGGDALLRCRCNALVRWSVQWFLTQSVQCCLRWSCGRTSVPWPTSKMLPTPARGEFSCVDPF